MIIGYLRVSTGKQHPANQQDEIRRFAESRNLTIDNWVTEVVSRTLTDVMAIMGRCLKVDVKRSVIANWGPYCVV